MIRLSGVVPVYDQFVPTTLVQLLDGIATAAIAAGWTRTNGSAGQSDQTLRSSVSPDGVQYKVRLVVNGSYLELYIRNLAETVTVGPINIQAGSVNWRIHAGPYQLFGKQNTPVSSYGWFVVSAPKLEAQELSAVQSLVLIGGPGAAEGWPHAESNLRSAGWILNGVVGQSMMTASTIGMPCIPTLSSLHNSGAGRKFASGEYFIQTPYLALGVSGYNDAAAVVGTLWDCAVWGRGFPGDSVRRAPAVEGGAVYNWAIVGNNNPMSLGLRIP